MGSDHKGDKDKAYSTSAAVMYLAGGPVHWRSAMQTVVTISAIEAEFVAGVVLLATY